MFISGIDECVDVRVQLVVRFLVDVNHVTRLIVGEADVLAQGRLESHMIHGVLDAVEGRSEVVVTAKHQHLQVCLLGDGGS